MAYKRNYARKTSRGFSKVAHIIEAIEDSSAQGIRYITLLCVRHWRNDFDPGLQEKPPEFFTSECEHCARELAKHTLKVLQNGTKAEKYSNAWGAWEPAVIMKAALP